jgi:hypothetical protein
VSESLDDFFTVNVTATTDTQTRAGFGTALFACCDVPWTSGARVREYASLAEVATAGFNSSKPGYRMAQAAFSQNPRPRSVKIGRRTRAFTQVVRLTPAAPVDAAAAETYTAEVDGLTAAFTSDATPTVAEVCTGLAAAINALTGVDADAILATGASATGDQTITTFDGIIGGAVMSPARRLSVTLSSSADWDASLITIYGTDEDGASINEAFTVPNNGAVTVNGTKYFRTVTSIGVSAQAGTGGTFTAGVRASVTADGTSGTHVTCTSAVAGLLHSYALATENLSLYDVTADPGLAADLGEILLADPDFYGLALDSQGEAEIQAAATWAESNRRLFVGQSADTGCGEVSTTDDILSLAQDAALGYTSLWFYPAIATAGSWLAAALLGNRLPVDPGSDTWAFKTLAGITVRPPTTSQRSAVLAKNGNVYERKNGVNVTFPGKTSLGEWVDVTRGLDWLRARIQEALFALQTANGKIPFTDEGIRLVCAAIYGVLSAGVDVGLFSKDPKPTVTAPRASAVSGASRSARDLPNVAFAAQLAGAIHTITVTGTASV